MLRKEKKKILNLILKFNVLELVSKYAHGTLFTAKRSLYATRK